MMETQKIGYDGVLMLEVAEQQRPGGRPEPFGGGTGTAGADVCHVLTKLFTMRAHISDIARYEGQQVTIDGWLHNRRSSGKIHFLIVRDGTGFIQAVMSKAAVGDEAFTRADHLSQETSLSVTGTVRADKRAKGGYEIDVASVEVHGESHDYPNHAEGARRRLSDGSPPSLDPHPNDRRPSCACGTR